MGGLTTQVLNTTSRQPAAGLKIELGMAIGNDWQHVKTVTTNQERRTGGFVSASGARKRVAIVHPRCWRRD